MFKKKKKFDYIVLVEGFKDVWLLYLLGIVAVSVFGHTLTQQQLYLIKQRTENVIICFDNDSDDDKNPGQKGAKKVYKSLSQNGINAINICPPSNVDVGNAFTNKEMRKWVEDNIVKTIQGIKNGKK